MGKPITAVGYVALRSSYSLRCPEPRVTSYVGTSARTRDRIVRPDGTEKLTYPAGGYPARQGLAAHLTFALKHEPLDLTTLAALFENSGATIEMQEWLREKPSSVYARIAGHLYEWITGGHLEFTLPKGSKRIPILDPKFYITGPEIRNARFGVIHNLLGTPAFSPLVRRTEKLNEYIAKKLDSRITSILGAVDAELLERAVNYLYLSETRSSFAIERETPSQERGELFRKLLEQAGANVELTEEELVSWQNQIITQPLRQEFSYRTKQNWLEKGGGSHASVTFVPPAPTDVAGMMTGIATLANLGRDGKLDPVVAATCTSFGLVFVHPFLDGNGRLHRFMLHHVLRQAGFTPKGVVLPVSARIMKRLEQYSQVLSAYSVPRTRTLEFIVDQDSATILVKSPQPRWLYAYFDATQMCEFIFECVEAAVDHDLAQELSYLSAYDEALRRVELLLDAPQTDLSLLIRLIVQNGNKLSNSKRQRFAKFTDEELRQVEDAVRDAFASHIAQFASNAHHD